MKIILIGTPEISFAYISKHSMLISNGCYILYNYNEYDKSPDTISSLFIKQALELDPSSSERGVYYKNRAAVHLKLNQYEEAISDTTAGKVLAVVANK